MAKVCRIVHSVDLNLSKYKELEKQASLLGDLRKEVWHRFGSINGSGADFRTIRNSWVKSRDFSPLPAKAWKETLRDVPDDILMYEEAAKKLVRAAILKRTSDKELRTTLFDALKTTAWKNNSYLRRKMRRHKKHGRTRVRNQIILETGVYSQFTGKNGNTWLKIPSFNKGKRICVPLNAKVRLHGCLRLILKKGVVYVHYTIDQKTFRARGDEVIGVDKGYSEAFADSEGRFYGVDLGPVLSKGTEKRNARGKARNKLYQLSKKKAHKAQNIWRRNLGRKKLEAQENLQRLRIRNIAFQAAHTLVDKAKEIRAEDLTKAFASKHKWKKFNRTMSGWAKGSLAEALGSVSKARGSCLRVVNAAYTSQVDSKTGRLEGRRVGDKFHHADGDVSHADTNAGGIIPDYPDGGKLEAPDHKNLRIKKSQILNGLVTEFRLAA